MISASICSICCENFNKSTRKEIVCGFCPKDSDFIACVSCIKRYLLETTQNAHCMNCKHEWNRIFIFEKLPKVFLNSEYKQRRQDLIEEREKSMMPSTQPHVEIAILKRRLNEYNKQINIIRHNSYITNLYSDKHLELEIERVKTEHKFHCLSNEIRIKENTKNNEINRVKFVRQCPMDNCKGFLSTAWKCGICSTHVCSHCHEPKIEGEEGDRKEGEREEEKEGDRKEEGEDRKEEGEDRKEERKKADKKIHVCNPDNVETARLLKKDSKPCPKCACMIFKISGCDQMFCTQCHTAFSWTSGNIETRIIHNPHYFQYLREQANGGEIPRNPLDNPCADILPEGQAFDAQTIHYIQNKLNRIPRFKDKLVIHKDISIYEEIQHIMQLCNHIVVYNYIREPNMNSNLDLRIQYMMNDITIEKYKQLLQSREKQNEKNHEFDMIFRTYVTAARDIIFNYVNLPEKEDRERLKVEVYNELQNLHNYINECFYRLIPIFNNYVWKISKRNNRYELEKIKS
jgi:hypothetical protein